MSNSASILADNLAEIRGRIAAAAERSGRPADTVKLVAVTKYVDPATACLLVEAGATDLGESRPQQLWSKAEATRDLPRIHWHLIGHLQRNKVRQTLPIVELIHSVDSQRLLAEISREAEKLGRRARVLLEVNISGDEAKHGFAPAELPAALPQLAAYEHVDIVGLMAMAHLEGGPTVARKDFAATRQLRDRLAADAPPDVSLDELSLGMSADFEEAILEGATIVRVGSALFEGLELDGR
jgi:pyridoxal phosphate enzyme (YggS family)